MVGTSASTGAAGPGTEGSLPPGLLKRWVNIVYRGLGKKKLDGVVLQDLIQAGMPARMAPDFFTVVRDGIRRGQKCVEREENADRVMAGIENPIARYAFAVAVQHTARRAFWIGLLCLLGAGVLGLFWLAHKVYKVMTVVRIFQPPEGPGPSKGSSSRRAPR